MRFLYLLANFFGEGELALSEFQSLTDRPPKGNWTILDKQFPVSRSAYVKYCIRLVAEGESMESIIKEIKNQDLHAGDFSVKVHNIHGSLAISRKIAENIRGKVDLSNPKKTFILACLDNKYFFGEQIHALQDFWSSHKNKHNISTSLPPRLARAMVNLAYPANKIIDPCCGSGTILIEGARIGCKMTGYDIYPHVAGLARKNLSTFGLRATVQVGDATKITGDFDAVVVDPSYTGDPLPILENLKNLAPYAVFVTTRDITTILDKLGYKLERVTQVRKHTSLRRYIYEFRTSA